MKEKRFSFNYIKMSNSTNQIIIIFIIILIAVGVLYYLKKKKDTTENNPEQKIEIVQENSNDSFYPSFVKGNDSKIRYNSPKFSYNPATNTLSASKFKGNLEGSASGINIQNTSIPPILQSKRMNAKTFRAETTTNETSTQDDITTDSIVAPAGQQYITLTNGIGRNQSLNANQSFRYDSANNTITARTNYTNNLVGGSAGNIPVQVDKDTTGFITNGQPNSVLLFDGNKPSWVLSSNVSFGGTALADNLKKTQSGVVIQSAVNTTNVLASPTQTDSYLSTLNGVPVWKTFSSTPSNAGTVNVVPL